MNNPEKKVKYKRVFLEEMDGARKQKKWRPLGVPNAEWRVALGIYNHQMYIWTRRFLPD